MIPGVSPSTTKAVNAFEIGAFGSGSLLHKTKNQLAGPAFVIHIFEPLMTYSSPFFSHFVFTPATSEPAHGSVTAYACNAFIKPSGTSMHIMALWGTSYNKHFTDTKMDNNAVSFIAIYVRFKLTGFESIQSFQLTAMRGSSVIRPRNFFLMGSLAARINGVSAKSFTSNAVAMAAHP